MERPFDLARGPLLWILYMNTADFGVPPIAASALIWVVPDTVTVFSVKPEAGTLLSIAAPVIVARALPLASVRSPPE